MFVFSQANKAGQSLKVPLSTFYVDQIEHSQYNAFEDVGLWVAYSQKEVETNHSSTIHIFSFVVSYSVFSAAKSHLQV